MDFIEIRPGELEKGILWGVLDQTAQKIFADMGARRLKIWPENRIKLILNFKYGK